MVHFEWTTEKPNYVSGVTPAFRISYPKLITPDLGPGGAGEPKFSIRMLFPKNMDAADAERLELMRKCCGQVARAFFCKKPEDQLPKALKKPIHDGDGEDGKKGEGGFWTANARTNAENKPECVDQEKEHMDDERVKREIYPGCWCRAHISIGATDKAGSKCVFFVLNHVQKVKDDTRLAGKGSADDCFDAVEYSEAQEAFAEEGAF